MESTVIGSPYPRGPRACGGTLAQGAERRATLAVPLSLWEVTTVSEPADVPGHTVLAVIMHCTDIEAQKS